MHASQAPLPLNYTSSPSGNILETELANFANALNPRGEAGSKRKQGYLRGFLALSTSQVLAVILRLTHGLLPVKVKAQLRRSQFASLLAHLHRDRESPL